LTLHVSIISTGRFSVKWNDVRNGHPLTRGDAGKYY
jgi:hypothetical protein